MLHKGNSMFQYIQAIQESQGTKSPLQKLGQLVSKLVLFFMTFLLCHKFSRILAVLSWFFGAMLMRNLVAFLVRDLVAFFPWLLVANLLRFLPALVVGLRVALLDIVALLQGHLNAMFVWNMVAQFLFLLPLPQQLLDQGKPLPTVVDMFGFFIFGFFVFVVLMFRASLFSPFFRKPGKPIPVTLIEVFLAGRMNLMVADLLVFHRTLFLLHNLTLGVGGTLLNILLAALFHMLSVANLLIMLRTLGGVFLHALIFVLFMADLLICDVTYWMHVLGPNNVTLLWVLLKQLLERLRIVRQK